jgi:uncharacterized membrane protein
MALTLGILFGIIAMLGWGVADFFVAKAVRKTNVLKAFVWNQIVGLTLIFLVFLFYFKFPVISFSTVIIILIAGFLGVISNFAFYKGLQVGNVSIISPISASAAAITVILSLIFLNEALSTLQVIGVILAILGAALTSFKFHDLIRLRLKNIATGVEYAIVAMLGWGVLFVLVDVLVSKLGWFLPILFIKTIIVFMLLTYSTTTKKNISFPKNAALFVILIGVLESAAFLAMGAGVSSEYTAIVAPVAFAFPAVTIILARIFFKEILEINQKIGIVSVLAGLVLLSI